MARPRDTQRKKLYLAEDSLRHHPANDKLPTVPEMQAFVDKLLAEAWSRRRFGNANVEVHDGRGRSRAGGSRKTWRGPAWITMPTWSRSKLIVCHELAHALAGENEAAHGPEFTRRYLELVEHVLSDGAARMLRERFVQARVKVGPPLVLRDLKPLPEPTRPWRIEATDAEGNVTPFTIEAVNLRQALTTFLHRSQGSAFVAASARRVRRSVKATGT